MDASGFKFSEKDMKPGKIKLKKSSKSAKGKKPGSSKIYTAVSTLLFRNR